MRTSQHLVSFRTYALAFAVALSPAMLQQVSCERGVTTLTSLEFEVDGVNQIAFTGTLSYDVSTTSDTAIVRAQATDPAAVVDYQWWAGSSFLESGPIGVGGGEVTLSIPPGDTTLRVYVRPPEGNYAHYSVNVAGRFELPCTEQGILDAIASGGGPFTFDCGGPTTVVTTDTIVIDNDVILDGGAGLTVDGNDSDHHIFQVAVGVTAELRGFVVTHSAVPPTLGWGAGGIFNEGTLTLTNSTVSGNHGMWEGICVGRGCSGWSIGGGVFNAGGAVLTLTDSVVSGNYADFGGGIHNPGTLTVMNSTVSGNGGGGIYSAGALTVTNSNVSGNGGDGVSGAGTIVNSTVSENEGVGIYGAFALTNTTVAGNGAGAILVLQPAALANSIINGHCIVAGASTGYNIESPGNTCGFDQASDQVDVTAAELNLGPLQDNGGPTETHALGPGSVALDILPEAACVGPDGMPLASDQRGVARPQGLACDVGAFELEQ